ncbi:putative D-xylose utilization operon transcriptional repressor [Streptomyces sp. MBT84]|uniref:GntR family transcriptional regulator n=1 Tax=Streptomyces sp. MBT84 TaxID=1488414 RepID=UPI001C6F0F7B|nr:GntR family transcriptional regulator [Streptomyces sp. MBT84]MBW8699666.1 putative D-xylose utilization operon transcriptional repressor [Streptomyces sp. MBT84]
MRAALAYRGTGHIAHSRIGIGRNTLREALSRLSSDGLVTIAPHRGASVRRLTRTDVEQLYELREVLEGLAARLAALRIKAPGHRDRLLAALNAVQETARTAEMPQYIDENLRFHRTVVEMSGHTRLLELVDQLQLQTFRVQFRSAAAHDRTGMRGFSVSEHQSLAEAILAGDAENIMRTHLRHTGSSILQLPDSDFA